MIEHNTPKLEERLAKANNEIEFWSNLLSKYEQDMRECKKNINSSILSKNEIELLKNIRDGKYVILDLDKMEFLKTKWV